MADEYEEGDGKGRKSKRRRLKVENDYMRKILGILQNNIIVRDAKPQMELEPPELLVNDQPLMDLTSTVCKVSDKFYTLEIELDNTYRKVSQLSIMIAGLDGSKMTASQENKNTLTATARKPRSISAQINKQSQQYLKLKKDLEFIKTAWQDIKERERSAENIANSRSNFTDPKRSDSEDDRKKLFQALKTIQLLKLDHLEYQLPEQNSEIAATGFYEQSRQVQEQSRQIQEKSMQLQDQGRQLHDQERQLKEKERQLQDQERQLQEQSRQIQGQSMQIQDQGRQLRGQERQLKEKERQLQDQERQLQEQSRQIQEQSMQIQDQGRQLQGQERQLKNQERQLQEKDGQLEKHKQEMRKVCKEKEDALSRLCRHMGNQILDGNPNITDLSDPNIPSKLAERYVELYDNEWSNAFEDLTSINLNDKAMIDVLRRILWETYNSAFQISQRQMEEVEYMLYGSSKPLSPECKRLLKEALKHIDIEKADSFKNALEIPMMKSLEEKIPENTRVDIFAKKCFQLCWFMLIQDPPVVLVEEPSQGSVFDTNMYKYYTASGDRVDYVVWPALLLHKHGPILTKGVAQPFPRPRAKSAFPLGEKNKANGGTVDKFSQSLHTGRLQERTSATKMNPYQDGCGAQMSSSLQKKLHNDPTGTQNYPSHEVLTSTQRYLALMSDKDAEQFNLFCNLYLTDSEATMRMNFGSDFDHYNDLYLQKYGHHSHA